MKINKRHLRPPPTPLAGGADSGGGYFRDGKERGWPTCTVRLKVMVPWFTLFTVYSLEIPGQAVVVSPYLYSLKVIITNI